MKSCSVQNGDVWSYHETSNRALMGATAFAFFVVGSAVLMVGGSLQEKLPFVLLLLVVCGVMLWSSKRATAVAINRKDATIRIHKRSIIFSRCRAYSLRDFHAAVLTEDVRTGEEGYLMTDYSLVLHGPEHSLTVITTNDRKEAVQLQGELQEYFEDDPRHQSTRRDPPDMVE